MGHELDKVYRQGGYPINRVNPDTPSTNHTP